MNPSPPKSRARLLQRLKRPGGPLLPLGIHGLAVSVPWGMTLFMDAPAVILMVGGSVMLAAYLAIAAIEASRAPLVVTPVSFYFLWYAVSLGASPIYMANRLGRGEVIGFSTAFIPPAYVLSGYLIFLLGSLALHVGLQLARPRAGHREKPRLLGDSTGVSQTVLLGIWIISIVVRTGWDALSFLGAFRGLLSQGSLAAVTLYALRGRDPAARTPAYFLVVAVGVGMEFLMNVRSGSKAFIMYSFIPVLWLIVAAPRLRALIFPVGIALGAFYLLIVAPVVMTSRSQKKSDGQSTLGHMIGVYREGQFVDESNQLDHFLERQFDPIPVGFILADVERFGFRYGETLDYLAYAFIPRAIWPDKPSVSRGAWFTMYLGAASSEETATSSTGITAVGELYWNFGVPGVLLGMALIGLLIGAQWRMAGVHPESDAVRFLLYVALVVTMPDMAEAGTAILAAVYRILVIAAISVLVTAALRLAAQRSSHVAV